MGRSRRPAIGAYEYNGTDWTLGPNFSNPPSPVWTAPTALHRNRVHNGGFEYGDLSSWTKTGASLAETPFGNHWPLGESEGTSRSQFYSVQLGGSCAVDGVEQTVTGLSPDAAYVASAWLRSLKS